MEHRITGLIKAVMQGLSSLDITLTVSDIVAYALMLCFVSTLLYFAERIDEKNP